MFGRMLFSCLVDADYRDTEKFYAEARGKGVDRDWSMLATTIERLIARFDVHTHRERDLRHSRGTGP